MDNKLFGIDFGTGGCKATIIDTHGNVCATAFEEYPSVHLHSGWSEQNPELWIQALINTIKECHKQMDNNFSEIRCIAITASTHNAVLLDSNSNVIRNCIMWNDQRSSSQCAKLQEQYGETIFKIAMAMPTTTWTLPQLMWVKENEPENYSKISRILFTKDYIRSYITGDNLTDIVDAQGSLLYDALENKWSKEICDMIDLSTEMLPDVKPSKSIAGTVQKHISDICGLPEGIPVIVGCSDTAAEDFGAGAVKEGQLIVKIATAGNVNIVSSKANPHPKTFTYPYAVEGMWYTVTATNSAASSYRWLRDGFYATEKAMFDSLGDDVYKLMDREASQAPLGSEGLIFHPYILGERCPYFNSKARGDFFGVNMIHSRKHFARAVLEGVAFSLYDCLQVLSSFNKNLEDIRILGGGAKSPLWSQIVCDIFGLDVKFPQNAESSFGGALLAGVGIGLFENEIEAAEKCVRIEKHYKPNMNNHKKYQKLFKLYQNISRNSVTLWDELSEL